MLHARLLGTYEVRLKDRPIDLPSRPAQSLLAYLLLNPNQPIRREKLAGLIWPDSTESNARSNLRSALWRVRKSFDSHGDTYLQVNNLTISFQLQATDWLDVQVVDAKITDQTTTDALAEIVEAFGGELLPGFYEDWVVLERQRLNAVYGQKMDLFLDRLVAESRWGEVLEWGERWISMGFIPESAYQAAMIAHAAQGDLGKVAGVYQRCVLALERDLGIQPSKRTQDIYQGLIQGNLAEILPQARTSELPQGTLTFLFSDIEGSTIFWDQDPKAMRADLARHNAILEEAIQAFDGHVFKVVGDEFQVAFSLPDQAIGAALRAQRALSGEDWEEPSLIKVRMGLHVGPAETDGGDYLPSPTLNRVSRIMSTGHGGQILLSEPIADLVRRSLPDDASLKDLGEHYLKGLSRPEHIFQVVVPDLPAKFPPLVTRIAPRGYKLLEQIGEGSFGAVYRAFQPEVNREVAVKVVLPQYANDPEFIRRFEAEAQVVARLEHPYIVPLYDYWREPDSAYLVMRYLRAGSLADLLERGPLDLERASVLVEQIGAALGAAHRQGIVHRDLKPANILMDASGNFYLSDFGIAKDIASQVQATLTGESLGTPLYMSPEQMLGEAVTPRSDIYSLGLVLYQALTAEPPYPDDSIAALIECQLHEPLPLVTTLRPEIPEEIDQVLQLATAKQSSERFRDVLEVVKTFQTALSGKTLPLKPTSPEAVVENPYKGLRSFQEADAEDFFGRDAMTQRLLARLNSIENVASTNGHAPGEGHFLAVVGPSGSGKSSLVKAGLIPALRRGGLPGSQNWFVVDFIPGVHPMEELEAALLRVAVNPPESLLGQLNESERGLLRAVRRILPSDETIELVLVIDQFEEVFTLVAEEERRARFLDSLVTAVENPRTRLRVVLTLRADFTNQPLQYLDFGELFRQGAEFVLPMSPDELEQAIAGPARRAGLIIEPGLVEQIISEVSDQPGTLPLLQHALTELFERREGRRLTLIAYRASGGVLGALGQRAQEVYSKLDERGQELTRQMFLRLITLGEGVVGGSDAPDTRRRVLRSELEALADPGSDQKSILAGVLDAFGRYRLLTFDHDPVTRGPTVEVAHEALLREWSRLSQWLDSGRNDVRTQRLLGIAVEEWVQAGMDPGFLLGGSRLDQFWEWAEETSILLTREEQAFLEASLRARRERQAAEEARRQRELETARKLAETETKRAEEQTLAAGRLRRRALYLTLALSIASLLAVLAFGFSRSASQNAASAAAEADASATQQALAEEQASLATSRELALAADNNLQSDPERSILLALQALQTAYTKQAEGALHRALQTSRTLLTLPAHHDGVDNLAYSPDGLHLATVGEDGTVKLWNSHTGELLQTLPFSGQIQMLQSFPLLGFDNTGQRLALLTVSDDLQQITLFTWLVDSGQQITQNTMPVSLDEWYWLALSPDWSTLAIGFENGTTQLWDFREKRKLLTLTGHDDRIKRIRFSSDGSLLATASADGKVIVWDVPSSLAGGEGISTGTFTAHTQGYLGEIAFDAANTHMAVGSINGQVEIWNLGDTGAPQVSLSGHNNVIYDLAFSPDGSSLATASADGTAKVWDLATGKELFSLAGHRAAISGVAFDPSGNRLATASLDGTARIWNARPQEPGELLTLGANLGVTFDVELSPDERWLALGNAAGPASLWDAQTGQLLMTFPGEAGTPVYRVSFSPDGSRLATVGADNIIRVWDLATGETLLAFTGHGEGLSGGLYVGTIDVSYSPDGTRLATAGTDGTAKVWDARTGEQLLSLPKQAAGLHSLAYSPDGRFIAISIDEPDSSVKVWDAQTGQEIYTLAGHPVRVWGLAFSPDSTRLGTSGFGGVVKVWDMLTGKELYTLPGQVNTVTDVEFSSDGKLLITAGTVTRVWDAQTGAELLTLAPAARRMDLSKDGRRLYLGLKSGVVGVFDVRLQDTVTLARSRLTRGFTPDECRQYLHMQECPQNQP